MEIITLDHQVYQDLVTRINRISDYVFKKAAVQVLILLAGIAMLIFGIWREEAQTVFSKAIRLCMECVGIG